MTRYYYSVVHCCVREREERERGGGDSSKGIYEGLAFGGLREDGMSPHPNYQHDMNTYAVFPSTKMVPVYMQHL